MNEMNSVQENIARLVSSADLDNALVFVEYPSIMVYNGTDCCGYNSYRTRRARQGGHYNRCALEKLPNHDDAQIFVFIK